MENLSILEIDAFHPVAHAGEDFVRDSPQSVTQHRHGQVVSKDDGRISFVTIDVGDINHAHIHTDITYVRSLFAIHQAIASPVSQAAVEPVSISDGQGGNA